MIYDPKEHARAEYCRLILKLLLGCDEAMSAESISQRLNNRDIPLEEIRLCSERLGQQSLLTERKGRERLWTLTEDGKREAEKLLLVPKTPPPKTPAQ